MSDELRSLIDASRAGDEPTEEDRARVRRALAASLAVGTGVTATAASAASAGVGAGTKAIAALCVVGALAAGGAWLARPAPPAAPLRPRALSPAPPPRRPSSPAPAPPASAAPAPSRDLRARAAPPPARPTSPAPRAARAIPAPAEPPPAPPALAPTPPSPTPTVAPEASAAPPADGAPGASRSAPSAMAPPPDLAVLAEARSLLRRGEAAQAIQRLDDFARANPTAPRPVERSSARLIASCALGAATAREVRAFLDQHGDTPLAAGVRDRCGALLRAPR